MRPVLLAAMLAASSPAAAAPLVWLFSEEPEGDAKLGITAPDANTYGLVLMRCRPGSGRVRLNIDIATRELAAVGAAVRNQRPLVVELAAGGNAIVTTPGLGFNHHDSVWQYTVALDLSDALLQALGGSGSLSIKGVSARYTYKADGIGDAMPAFASACKPR